MISAGVGLAAGDPTPAASRVNVLLVCVDDLKPAIGCYGDALAKTPNIDRLAAHGVRFERAYCNQAVCSPSRNALLTGFRPQSLGIYDLATNFRRAAPTVRTLPQLFRDGGFHASALGKIFHVGHGNHDGFKHPAFAAVDFLYRAACWRRKHNVVLILTGTQRLATFNRIPHSHQKSRLDAHQIAPQ